MGEASSREGLCGRSLLALWVLSTVGCGAQQYTFRDGLAAVQRGDAAGAVAIYETIAREKADTLEGAAATDAVIELTGQRLFPERSYRCSAEAVGEYHDLLASFGILPDEFGWMELTIERTFPDLQEGPVADQDGDRFVVCESSNPNATVLGFEMYREPRAMYDIDPVEGQPAIVIELSAR